MWLIYANLTCSFVVVFLFVFWLPNIFIGIGWAAVGLQRNTFWCGAMLFKGSV